MTAKIDLKSELKSISSEGQSVLLTAVNAEEKRKKDKADIGHIGTTIRGIYQKWYTKAVPVVTLLAPERVEEFVEQYKFGKRKDIEITNYGIADFIMGYSAPNYYDIDSGGHKPKFDPFMVFYTRLEHQISILDSLFEKFEFAITNIESVLHVSLMDGELGAANTLAKNGHLRAAGAVTGVVLEGHLKSVCVRHAISIRKKNPGIGDFNDKLKDGRIIAVPTWRLIQRLGDIRNICVHSKDQDPLVDEVRDLISGTQKVISEVY